MEGALLRSTLLTVAFAVAMLGIPMLFLGLLVLGRMPQGSDQLVQVTQAGNGTELLVAYVLFFALVAVVGAVLIARHQARRFSVPLAELADQAERLGAGAARYDPVPSGLPEIDRVAAALAGTATQWQRILSTERQFASDASHQLRTPLTAVLMRLEEISLTDDIEVAREEAGVAIEQVERLNVTVDELLARARHGSAGAPRPTSVDAVLAALLREWAPQFERCSRSVKVEGDRGLMVVATPIALSQVLATLLENALVHGKGIVDVEVRRAGPSVVLEVRNSGWVPREIAGRVFERSVSTSSTGLGLGLARDLAEKYGGRLDLVSAHDPVVFALFMSAADVSAPTARQVVADAG
ncbi:sensor histidine kinase [Mobilicoccus pelagius]|uniref:histidine kinase n=1 Tax=Mobilicoccus pelagius NBRC 104925 TaxID=1089455 RepID=H5UN22_9MICO|nr:HAMP domain-containing sensor histidine kinase [Mobilicoccus pelagius]GAB47130.1 putative two-component histidine kinase [Mobilicoccus pelagius NBRC 104925]